MTAQPLSSLRCLGAVPSQGPFSLFFFPCTRATPHTVHLCYTPDTRLKPLEACAHRFFDELRDPDFKLPDGRPPPPLFNFTDEEVKAAGPLLPKLQPRKAGTSNADSAGPAGGGGGGFS